MLKNHTIWIERHDCAQCVAINTTICSGYCYTQDTNLKGRFGRTFLIQRSCVPRSLVYRAARFPGCPQDVNPQLYYPEARCCRCNRCDSRLLHCVRSSRIPHDRCTMAHGNLKNQNQPALET
ncbi:follitropin subunit beta-like [Scomber scombrus]|uniref:Gonadotropin subunit beta-2 n=1 Tax=Scomber scombrus TaxID=13677 RepID=A0AAV1P956_SCOSC